jgi:hypothetical protein
LKLAKPEDERPRDIEALARVGDAVLVVGSHSRRRTVRTIRSGRLRLVRMDADGELEAEGFLDGSGAGSGRARPGRRRRSRPRRPRRRHPIGGRIH